MSRTQQVGERIIEFATDLWKLAEEAFVEVPSERIDFLLRDRFIGGLLPDFIQFCEFDQCATFSSALECARKMEERVLSAQAAQRFHSQRPIKVNPAAEQTEDKQLTDILLGVAAEIDAFRLEMRSSQKELLDVVRATNEGARNFGNSSRRENNKSQRTFRWAEDGSPVCSYCSKVGHKYRNCHQRRRDEVSANGRSGQSDQGSRPVSPRTRPEVPPPVAPPTIRHEGWEAQNAVGIQPSVDPYLQGTQVTPHYESTSQQLSAELNALREE
ncbi:MAG: hypothetical protein GY927_08555, partial [bacterium]|nr:hypothetical protein [bacterium]